MPRFLVQAKITIYTNDFEVEAADESGANLEARRIADAMTRKKKIVDSVVLRQVGEPWVYAADYRGLWYDLHPPNDVIVIKRSLGNIFSEDELVVLRKRITEVLQVQIVESWNGRGCGTVSFRCTGRRGTENTTPEQTAAVLAPLG